MQELYINTPEQLVQLCARLRDCREIALDTEFVRERTYYAQFCLLQLATDDLLACVDPLAIPDLSPLLAILYDSAIVKVMHAGRQDLELFFDIRGEVPQTVYDTQIAATLLGLGDQIGYASLVALFSGDVLDKSHSRTDWSRRPLNEAQIKYALDDVRYLLPIYRQQQQQLVDLGRAGWLAEDFAALVAEENYHCDSAEAWQRLRAARELRGVQLAVLRDLVAWREDQARTRNSPRKWIISDELLIELARRSPADLPSLQRIRGLPESLQADNGTLLSLISQARGTPQEQWPTLTRRLPLSAGQEALVDALQAELHLCQAQSGIDATVIASRRELGALVQGARDLRVLHGWRRHLAGEHLLAFLQGNEGLQVCSGELQQIPLDNN